MPNLPKGPMSTMSIQKIAVLIGLILAGLWAFKKFA